MKYVPNVKHHIRWKAFSCLYNSCDNSADTIDIEKTIEDQTAGVKSCFDSRGRRNKMKSTLLQSLRLQMPNKQISTYVCTLNVGAGLN